MNKTTSFGTNCALILITLTFGMAPLRADDAGRASLQATLMLKLVPYYNNLQGRNFRIHVIGAPDVAGVLKTQLGRSFRKAVLTDVTSSELVPDGHADIVFWGDGADPGAIANLNGLLSISGNPAFVEKGVTLGIVLDENQRPEILLNLQSSKTEGADWKPAILGVVETL